MWLVVINLSPDKSAVMASVQCLLKPGGEFCFSDIYCDRRIPQHLVDDLVLYGECLSGALYWNDFIRLARESDFLDPRLVEDRPLEITDSTLATKSGNIQFFSATYRLFKIAELEDASENYGQAVIYNGTVEQMAYHFELDKHHVIETGRVFPMCANTFRMLKESCFSSHFEFIGDDSHHYGIFAGCADTIPFGGPDSFIANTAVGSNTQSAATSDRCC